MIVQVPWTISYLKQVILSTEQIAGGQIGSRPRGNGGIWFKLLYTLLGENSIVLKDDIMLKNSGNTPELWGALEDGTNASWRVSGDVFYNLSSMTSGQENELHFEFTKIDTNSIIKF